MQLNHHKKLVMFLISLDGFAP